MTVQGQRLVTRIATARSQVDLWAAVPLGISLDTRFDPPAVNWPGSMAGDQPKQYPDQWHATVNPVQKVEGMRFLVVIQVRTIADATPFDEPSVAGQNEFHIGPWRVEAELSAARDAALLLERADGKAALAADRPRLILIDKSYDLPPHGAILVEQPGGIVQSCEDQLRAE